MSREVLLARVSTCFIIANPNPETVHVPFCYNASSRPAVLPCSYVLFHPGCIYPPCSISLHTYLSLRALRLQPSPPSLVRRCLYTIVC